ncbi:MAG: fasciclin domain-containing protein [Marinifilaceae bacterium]
MKKYIILFVAFLSALAGCQDDFSDKKFLSFDELVVLDYVAQTPKYSEWYNLIVRAEMSETYKLSTTPMTCFIVDNNALQSYLKDKYNYQSVEQLSVEQAQILVKYHTLPNTAMLLSSFRNGKLADSTATGDYLACLFTSGDNGAVYINQTSKIVNFDKEMVNGIVHEVDCVIDPVVLNFANYLEVNKEKYGIWNTLFERSNEETKALFSQLSHESVNGMQSRRTLFLTSDETYAREGIESADDLLVQLGVDNIDEYVRYHMLTRELYGKDIVTRLEYGSVTKGGDGTSSMTHKFVDTKGITLETMAANKLIVAKDDGLLDIIFNEDVTGGLKFISESGYNIPVKNGVVHELDGVLKIANPSSMITVMELSDYINFQRIPSYRSPAIGKTQTLMKAEEYSPFINWESTPVSKGDAVAYVVFTEGSYNFKGNGFLNGDCLFISPGPVGYVEFQTPPIPKGTYSVWPFYKTTKNTGGKYKVSIDGTQVGGEFTAYTPGTDNYWITQLGTVTFTETKSHTIRVSVGSRQGEILLDLFFFEPIN